MKLDSAGWLDLAGVVASPNFDERPPAMPVELVVIHAISLPPGVYGGSYVADFFRNQLNVNVHPYFPGICHLRVSSHFFIDRQGRLTQFVSCHKRAWHAGVSSWNGRDRCNDFSIGIELEGCDQEAFAAEQYQCLNLLLGRLMADFPIKAVLGHSDIAPGRKTDPGPFFDWNRVLRPTLVAGDMASN